MNGSANIPVAPAKSGRITTCAFGVAMLRAFWWTTLVAGIALAASLATMLTVPWPVAWTVGWKA